MSRLVADPPPTHKPASMAPGLYDSDLRALRRDRAARLGPELFLVERAFDDCLERIAMMQRPFSRALLIGCPDPSFAQRLTTGAASVDVVEPGRLFAAAAGGDVVVEDQWEPEPGAYDLVLALGTLDTVDDLPRALLACRLALGSDALLIGALPGGETLPQLRAAMRAADDGAGGATPHVHPRIEPAAFTGLLGAAGFERAVVDIDRVQVAYPSFQRLVDDLRRMAATNLLAARSRRPLSREQLSRAAAIFQSGRTIETFEILHFATWTPANRARG